MLNVYVLELEHVLGLLLFYFIIECISDAVCCYSKSVKELYSLTNKMTKFSYEVITNISSLM